MHLKPDPEAVDFHVPVCYCRRLTSEQMHVTARVVSMILQHWLSAATRLSAQTLPSAVCVWRKYCLALVLI